MSKPDVFKLRAPVLDWHTFEFKDPATGTVYPLRLRPIHEMEWYASREFAQKMIARYITGGIADPSSDVRKTGEVMATVQNEAGEDILITPTAEALTVLAELEWMQGLRRDVFDDSRKEGAYTAVEMAILSLVARPVWDEFCAARRKVNSGAVRQKKARTDSDGTLQEQDSGSQDSTRPQSST